MRKPIIAGNWKMNKTPSEAKALVEALKPLVADAGCDVVLCLTPFATTAVSGANRSRSVPSSSALPSSSITGASA